MTRPKSIRGAHACGVLVAPKAFASDELSSAFATSLVSYIQPSSFRQDAETSRLEACATQDLSIPF